MKCPSCSEKAITFRNWCQGLNAFSTKCMNCNAPLKAKFSIYLGFIISSLIIVVPIPFLEEIWSYLNVARPSGFVELLTLIILALPTTYLTWKIGGYWLAEDRY